MGGNLAGFFIWQFGSLVKIAKFNLPIINPRDSGQHSSTYGYALYQYLKIAIFPPENARYQVFLSLWEGILLVL